MAYDSEAGIIKHFRVDKMLDIGILDEARDGQESFAALDMAEYAGWAGRRCSSRTGRAASP